MGFLKGVAKSVGTLLLGGVGQALGIGKKKDPVQPRATARDPAIEAMEADDTLRRRKGAAADMITGTRGAEAAASSIGRLVVGS